MRQHGFTLLEVLAAALILGIAYTALLGLHIEAARAEGRALVSLDAGRIADEKLADLEALLKPDEKIERIEEEGELDGFKYSMRIAGLSACLLRQAAGLEEVSEADAESRAALTGVLTRLQGMANDLVCLQVIVSWPDGESFGQIQRVSFAYDRAATLERLEQLQQNAQANNEGGARQDNRLATEPARTRPNESREPQ